MKRKPSGARPPRPYVSVIIPMRNEARHIGPCLRSLLRCSYPRHRWEIIVVDGMSDDDSWCETINVLAESRVPIRLLDNPRGITPTALNIALANARGEIIIRVDAHAEFGEDYVTRCVRVLEETGAENVGGPVTTRPGAATSMARAIALAMAHPFGVGNSAFRTARVAAEVDTVPFGCFRTHIFQRVGLFDERLARNQDYEFNQRLRQSGGRIWLDPRLESTYVSRATLRGLLRQAWDNGFWNALTHALHPYSICPRHVLPVAFSLGLLPAATLAMLHVGWWLLCLPLWGAYLLYSLLALLTTTRLAFRHGLRLWPALFVVFPTFHLVYGAGIAWGWTHALLRRYPWQPNDGIPTWEERRDQRYDQLAA